MSQVVIYSTIIELVIVNAIQVIYIISHPVTMNKLIEKTFIIWLMIESKGTQKLRFVLLIVDSDVVVIGISMFEHIGLRELWIDFGTGKANRHIPVFTIVRPLFHSLALPLFHSLALPLFHSFTWCDTTFSFLGLVKRLHGQHGTHSLTSRSSQCSTTGVTNAVVCVILSVG